MNSTKMYEASARKASADGHRPGSPEWWAAIRTYNQHYRHANDTSNNINPPSFS